MLPAQATTPKTEVPSMKTPARAGSRPAFGRPGLDVLRHHLNPATWPPCWRSIKHWVGGSGVVSPDWMPATMRRSSAALMKPGRSMIWRPTKGLRHSGCRSRRRISTSTWY